MAKSIESTPRLHRVYNATTGEMCTAFVKNKMHAIKTLHMNPTDDITLQEVTVTTEDGCSNRIFLLKDVPSSTSGAFFRTVNYKTLKVGKTVYIKQRNDYDRSTKKYCCNKYMDFCDSHNFKPTQWVITEFTF